jgi:hypothetical protein
VTFALVRSFRDRTARLGASLLVTNAGHATETMELHKALRPRLTAAGIPWLGLEESLAHARGTEPEKLGEFHRNEHWNRDAHRLAAETVLAALRSSRLL